MSNIPSEQKLILSYLGSFLEGAYLLKQDYLYVKMKNLTTAYPITNKDVSLKEKIDCTADANKHCFFIGPSSIGPIK